MNFYKLFKVFILIFLFNYPSNFCQSLFDNNVSVTKRIILIGDAGDPSKKGKEPVLVAAERIASEVQDSTVIIFLGDNIYPFGLPDDSHPDRFYYENQILQQINVIINSKAKGFFIPGNHDWNRGNRDGLDYIKRQSDFVNKYSDEEVHFKPKNGCPGPDYYDFGEDLRIIFLDTQWWLQNKEFRYANNYNCDFTTEEAIIDNLRYLLSDESKFIIISAHHPLISYGKHGGNFSTKTHLFPLTELNESFYLPLPIIGSIFAFVRNFGISQQDISNPIYASMKNNFENIIRQRSGVLYASGHDHVLQILKGVNDNLYVVSGAGIFDQADDYVGRGKETLYAEAVPGFFIVDFLSNHKIRLSAVKVKDRSASTEISFSITTR